MSHRVAAFARRLRSSNRTAQSGGPWGAATRPSAHDGGRFAPPLEGSNRGPAATFTELGMAPLRGPNPGEDPSHDALGGHRVARLAFALRPMELDRLFGLRGRGKNLFPTERLLNILRSHKIDPKLLITHRFKLDRILDAYETFEHAANTRALKVTIEA